MLYFVVNIFPRDKFSRGKFPHCKFPQSKIPHGKFPHIFGKSQLTKGLLN